MKTTTRGRASNGRFVSQSLHVKRMGLRDYFSIVLAAGAAIGMGFLLTRCHAVWGRDICVPLVTLSQDFMLPLE